MKIIEGQAEDLEVCLTIARKLDQYFTEEAVATIDRDVRIYPTYVAVISSQVHGFATIQCRNDNVAEILWMAVNPKYRRQGIGSALVEHITNDLRQRGIRLLEVKTLSGDVDYPPYVATRRFYEKMGFLHFETIDPYPGWEPGNPCAIYLKVLPAE